MILPYARPPSRTSQPRSSPLLSLPLSTSLSKRQDELQWCGILGAAADILQGQAASDPRVRYATSSVALEILGIGNEPTPVSRVAATPRHGLKQGRGVPLSGALSMITEGGGGYRDSGGSFSLSPERRVLQVFHAVYLDLGDRSECLKSCCNVMQCNNAMRISPVRSTMMPQFPVPSSARLYDCRPQGSSG